MEISPSVGSIVGTSSPSHWAQTIKTQYMYGVIETQDAGGFAQEIGMRIIANIEVESRKPIASLHDVELLMSSVATPEIISLLLVVPVGKLLYLAVYGKGTVYLKRNGVYAKLLDHQGTISGEAKEGDIILLASHACEELLSEEEFLSVFDHLSAQEAAEQLTMRLHEKEGTLGCAAILFEIRQLILQEELHVFSSSGRMKRFVRSGPRYQWASIKRHVGRIPKYLTTPGAGITILLLVIFVVSVGMGIRREMSTRRDERVDTQVLEAERIFEEGQALMDLNPVKGRERLASAKHLLEPVKEIVSMKTKDGRRTLELYDQVVDALTAALHAYMVEPQLFYDAGLLKSGSTITTIGLYQDALALADANQKAVYILLIPAKTGQIIAGGDGFEKTLAVMVHGDTAYAVNPDGIHAISIADRKTKQNIIKKSEDWGIIRTAIFFGGNIYLLDTQKSRIWKYVGAENVQPAGGQGFSDIKEYLNPDTLPDLSSATWMAIDGSVWLGTTNGKILRFSQGKENTFTDRGVDPEFGTDLVVYTSDEVKNLYVLDKNNKRVVVLDKDGIYLAQYLWKGSITPSHLVVSEKHGKILLLADGKLYSIELK